MSDWITKMKKYLLPALLAVTAYAVLPHTALADQPKPARCAQGQTGKDCQPPRETPPWERPKDAAQPDRKSSRAEGGRAPGGDAQGHPGRDGAPRPERLVQSAREGGHDWVRGAKYTGKGARVDYQRADLPAPGKHQHWLRDGDSYLLISERTGVIAQVRPR